MNTDYTDYTDEIREDTMHLPQRAQRDTEDCGQVQELSQGSKGLQFMDSFVQTDGVVQCLRHSPMKI